MIGDPGRVVLRVVRPGGTGTLLAGFRAWAWRDAGATRELDGDEYRRWRQQAPAHEQLVLASATPFEVRLQVAKPVTADHAWVAQLRLGLRIEDGPLATVLLARGGQELSSSQIERLLEPELTGAVERLLSPPGGTAVTRDAHAFERFEDAVDRALEHYLADRGLTFAHCTAPEWIDRRADQRRILEQRALDAAAALAELQARLDEEVGRAEAQANADVDIALAEHERNRVLSELQRRVLAARAGLERSRAAVVEAEEANRTARATAEAERQRIQNDTNAARLAGLVSVAEPLLKRPSVTSAPRSTSYEDLLAELSKLQGGDDA